MQRILNDYSILSTVMSRTIKYLGFYDVESNPYTRQHSLPAVNKMNYLIEKLNHNGISVHLISPSWYVVPDAPFTRKKDIIAHENFKITFVPSFPTRNRYTRYIKVLFTKIWLFFYLLWHVRRNEEIIVYHSPVLITVIYWVKKIKKFKLTLEVEEIYSDLCDLRENVRKREMKLIHYADKYIFSSELLEEKLNISQKPAVVCHGVYKIEDDRMKRFDDDRIHIVYAGILEPRKGSHVAIKTAEFLDEQYHIHIIGYGDESSIEQLIQETRKKTSCRLSFDGTLRGEEYISFLHRCHIGLCTQEPVTAYNDTTFPSKVLSYLSNGLRVVAVEINSLKSSKISDLINYYHGSPQNVADVIKTIDTNDGYDSRRFIESLDREFSNNLLSTFLSI